MRCFYECFGFSDGRFERVFFFNSCFCCSCSFRVFSSFCCCLFLSPHCRLIFFLKKKRFIALFCFYNLLWHKHGLPCFCLFAFLHKFILLSRALCARVTLDNGMNLCYVLFERKERPRTLGRS